MKTILLVLLLTLTVYGQNEHLSAVDFDYLNFTREEIEDSYAGYSDFWKAINEKGLIVYQGGSGFVSWPFYLTAYYFDDNDSLYQVNIILADTTEYEAYVFPDVLMTFRNWYGNEVDYKEDEQGNKYYYWYFGLDMDEAEATVFVVKNFKTKGATQITQANLRRLKEVEGGQK